MDLIIAVNYVEDGGVKYNLNNNNTITCNPYFYVNTHLLFYALPSLQILFISS